MNLQDIFFEYGYKDILNSGDDSGSAVNLRPVIDFEHKPEELVAVYISKDKDELFFLLNGIATETAFLCSKWDERIRVLSIVNRKSDNYYKIKYNVIQLIVCSEESDKSRASDLSISRKIFIRGNIDANNRIDIDENQEVELPFYDISADKVYRDNDKAEQFNQLLPKDTKLFSLLRKVNRAEGRITDYVFEKSEFDQIKEWIEKC